MFDKNYEEYEITLNYNLSYEHEEPSKLKLEQNSPNPFSKETTIEFYLPQSGLIKLTLFDASGRTIYRVQEYFEQGTQKVSINKAEIKQSGLIYYQIEANEQRAIRSMIVVE
jgi:hypothetical protein